MEGFSVEEPSETPPTAPAAQVTSPERSPQHFDLSAEDPEAETAEGTSSFEQAFEKDPAANATQGQLSELCFALWRGLEDARHRWERG